MAIYVGIDGGGSKTEALFYRSETQTTIRLVGHASRTSSVGWETSREVVIALILEGLSKLGADVDSLASISGCMSGIDLPEQSKRMTSDLKQRFSHSTIEVVNDALAALAAGTKGEPGVVLIAGTGSIAMGEDEAGRIARSGGLGYFIGDEGSGFDIGRLGITAAIQSYEGRGPQTALWQRVCTHYRVEQPRELIPLIYDAEYAIGHIAAFAPEVLECSTTDDVARVIIDQAVQQYVQLIDSVQMQLGQTVGNKVVLAGGVITNDSVLLKKLEIVRPALAFELLKHDPVVGALFRAIRMHVDTANIREEEYCSWTNARSENTSAKFS